MSGCDYDVIVLGAGAPGEHCAGALELAGGRELRGERLLVATGRRPRVEGIGLENPLASRPTPAASPWTRACASAIAWGPSATSPASGR